MATPFPARRQKPIRTPGEGKSSIHDASSSTHIKPFRFIVLVIPTTMLVRNSSTIRLPNLLANWPYPRTCNPHYAAAKAESEEWVRSFHAFSSKGQRAFDKCDFGECLYFGMVSFRAHCMITGLLTALAYVNWGKGMSLMPPSLPRPV